MVSVIENENEIVFFFHFLFSFFSMQVMGEKGDDDVSFEVTISSKNFVGKWINQFSTRILVKQIILL